MRVLSVTLSLAVLAGCQTAAKPEGAFAKAPPAPVQPPPPPVPAKAPPPLPPPPPAAPRDEAKPVTADLSKFKGPAEGAELFGYDDGNGRIFMYTAGAVEIPVKIAADGAYDIVVNVSCDEAMGQKAKFTVAVDGQKAGGEITCSAVEDKAYTVRAELKAGDRKIAVAFLNDLYKENEYDLNMYVNGLVVKPAK
ncbi:MAG TPA: carbohydrate-binding domain-containing protein [Planctomycetota bacterium]